MSCDQPKVQLYLYLDGELAAPDALEVERHLQTCEPCQNEATAHHRLQTLLRTSLPEEEVPEHLWATIQRQLPGPVPSPSGPPRRIRKKRFWSGLSALVALLLLVFGMQKWLTPSAPTVVREIVDSQIRSHLTEAPYKQLPAHAADIRQWFRDRVEFSVLVPNLSSSRYDFLGVRLNYFLNRRVAEMAYTSQDHVVSFLMFSGGDIALNKKAIQTIANGEREFYVQRYKGYNTVLWKDQDFFCSLVSDLELTALLRIAREATGSLSAT